MQALDFLGLDDDESDGEEDEWEGETVYSSDLMERLSTSSGDLGDGWSLGTASSTESSAEPELDAVEGRSTLAPQVYAVLTRHGLFQQ